MSEQDECEDCNGTGYEKHGSADEKKCTTCKGTGKVPHTYTEEEINKIINFHGANGKLIDIFSLHGVLFVGNTTPIVTLENGQIKHCNGWDLSHEGQYTRFSTGNLAVSIDDFWDCHTPEEVHDTFGELLEERVKENLV